MGEMGGVLDSSGGVHVTTLELAIIAIWVYESVRREAEEGRRAGSSRYRNGWDE